MDDLKTVVLQLDFLQGPIWISDVETGEPLTGIQCVDNDEIVRKLNYEISYRYSSYYEFDSHDQACWVNEEQMDKDKPWMLEHLALLKKRLEEINDGSYIIEDRESKYWM